MTEPCKIGQSQLRAGIAPLLPKWIDADDALAGVALSLTPPSERTLPMIRNPLKSNVLYAWSDDDASATKLGLELLSQLGQGLFAGPAGLINLGIAVKETVCFLIDLNRHSVRVTDPLQIKLLMLLRDADGGLSTQQLRTLFGAPTAPTLVEIETALDALARTEAHNKPRPLVRVDQMIWKILI
jgi:hypothetical protein